MSAAEAYATLRRTGQHLLSVEEAAVIPAVRRLAKADGLQISQYRGSARDRKQMSRDQARRRPYRLALVDPARPTEIIAPDANR